VPSSGTARQSKLNNGADFRFVFAAAARSSDALFTVLARSNGRGYSRLGLAVGRKRIHRAVDRNRFKRLIRESFRQHSDRLAGLDLVVLARCQGKAENRQVFSSLHRHWQKIECYRDQGRIPAAASENG